MNDENSLSKAIADHLAEFLTDVHIDRAANQGAASLISKQAEEALAGNVDPKVLELLEDVTKAALQTGISRGRFELAKEIIAVMTKWAESR